MVKTFNTCADLNIKYQKILLGCKNNYRASITVGKGQVMMRVSVAQVWDVTAPSVPISGNEWAVKLRRNGEKINTVKVNDLAAHTIFDAKNILAGADEQYEVYITMIKTSDDSEQPTTEGHLEAWNNYAPIAIIFEVC